MVVKLTYTKDSDHQNREKGSIRRICELKILEIFIQTNKESDSVEQNMILDNIFDRLTRLSKEYSR